MRRTIIAMQLPWLLVFIAACTAKTEPVKLDVEERPRAEAAPQATKAEPESEYLREIDRLIPQMASEDVVVRQESQKTFELMCLSAARPGADGERVELCQQIIRRLSPETPRRARVWMIRQLERVGHDECVAALAALLGDPDALIRETARRALQHNPSASVRRVLEQALEQADSSEWRIALINALAAQREAASVGVLREWAGRPERGVAAAAIAALGDIGGEQAVEALYALWHEDNPVVRNQATAALLRIGEQLVEAGDREMAAQLFDDLYTHCDYEPTRLAALRGRALAKGPAGIVPLLRMMQDGEPEMQLRAARIAVEIPGEAVTLTLAMMMSKVPPAVQIALLEGLGQRGDPTARSAAINGAHAGDPEVRIAALRALQELGNRSDTLLLAQVAARTTDAERDAARTALAPLSGPEVDETILKAAQGLPDVGMRCELIRALAARWHHPAVPALLNASRDPAEDVQVAAFEALGELGRPEHLSDLVSRLVEELGDGPRAAAENAVVDLAARIGDAEQRADAVLTLLPDTSGNVRVSLIRVLGRVRGGRALETLRGEWRSAEPDGADAAIRALAGWPTAEVTADLLEIARAGTNEAHQVLALRGYVRLVRLPSERTPAETCEMLAAAMSLATRPDEKKLVLGGLAEVRHIDALMLADMCLGDETLRDEAGVTMLSVARALAAEQPDAATAAIEKVANTVTSDRVEQQLAEAAEFLERFAGYSASWLVAGPYFREGQGAAQVFELTFPPETTDASDVEWKPLGVNNRANPWVFQLDRAIGGSNRCVYVRTEVWSDKQQAARLEIGSDDAVKAWLNGDLVHSNFVHRGVTPGQDKVAIALSSGWNTLQLKIVQGGGVWGFCAGITGPNGEQIGSLKFRAE